MRFIGVTRYLQEPTFILAVDIYRMYRQGRKVESVNAIKGPEETGFDKDSELAINQQM